MARKKATPVLSKARAKPRKPKTSSAPGEAAKAHEWLMERAGEAPVAEPDPFGDAAWLEAERARKLSPKKVAEGYARPVEAVVVMAEPTEPTEPEEPPPPLEPLGRDPVTGRLIKGFKGRGRPKGARNKLGEAFLADMQADWAIYGPATIAAVRRERPHEYLKVVAGILPKELVVNHDPIEELDDDELVSILAAAREVERVHKESRERLGEAPVGKPPGVLLS